jgi:hypothetical protein
MRHRRNIFRSGVATGGVLLALLALPQRHAVAADPTTADCIGASDSSLTLRKEHKLRAARAQLLVCAAASCPEDIRNECIRRVADINAGMPTIVFEAKDAAGRDLSGVRVTMDGQVLAERLEGTALSIDPGEHTFVFETAGQPLVQKQFVIREGEKDRREGVVFGAIEPATAPSASKPAQQGLGTQRILAIAAAGIGLVGVGVGTAFGLQSMSKHDDAVQACPNLCADQRGVDLWNDAQSAGNVSTVGFAVGAAALVGAAVLWFTATTPASTQVGLGPRGLELKGAW